jgi:hypothetical protein
MKSFEKSSFSLTQKIRMTIPPMMIFLMRKVSSHPLDRKTYLYNTRDPSLKAKPEDIRSNRLQVLLQKCLVRSILHCQSAMTCLHPTCDESIGSNVVSAATRQRGTKPLIGKVIAQLTLLWTAPLAIIFNQLYHPVAMGHITACNTLQ